MLRLTEVASQSVTFVKPALRKAKTNTVNSINEMDGPSGHYLVVFSLDRPPLLAVMRRANAEHTLSRVDLKRTVTPIDRYQEVIRLSAWPARPRRHNLTFRPCIRP